MGGLIFPLLVLILAALGGIAFLMAAGEAVILAVDYLATPEKNLDPTPKVQPQNFIYNGEPFLIPNDYSFDSSTYDEHDFLNEQQVKLYNNEPSIYDKPETKEQSPNDPFYPQSLIVDIPIPEPQQPYPFPLPDPPIPFPVPDTKPKPDPSIDDPPKPYNINFPPSGDTPVNEGGEPTTPYEPTTPPVPHEDSDGDGSCDNHVSCGVYDPDPDAKGGGKDPLVIREGWGYFVFDAQRCSNATNSFDYDYDGFPEHMCYWYTPTTKIFFNDKYNNQTLIDGSQFSESPYTDLFQDLNGNVKIDEGELTPIDDPNFNSYHGSKAGWINPNNDRYEYCIMSSDFGNVVCTDPTYWQTQEWMK